MSTNVVGIDIEQFLRDPYATGIQRVLQYLAKEWPADTTARFVLPIPRKDDAFLALEPHQAAELLSLPFEFTGDRSELCAEVESWVEQNSRQPLTSSGLHEAFDSWLLPEVSYLPSVVTRFEEFRDHARTSMIGYDILPMIEPANYRFSPGRIAWVSEYFRMLAAADAVVCISDFAKRGIVERLRRPSNLLTTVAHPGGDHIPIRQGLPPERTTFIRVGTMEARKMPVEILEAFTDASDQGLQADLVFVGTPSASDNHINTRIRAAIDAGYPVRWVQGATDEQVYELVQHSSAFLSFGVEGYGIPVLEAIRLGTPVLFGGEQPAARLMEGVGAISARHAAPMPTDFGADVAGAIRDLDPYRVPSWQDFSERVRTAAATD